MEWTEVVAVVALSCLGSSGIFYLLFEHLLARRLRAYEDKLSLAHDREITSLKADLRVAAQEKETRYQLLQTKRAEVVARLYELIVKAHTEAVGAAGMVEAGICYDTQPEPEAEIQPIESFVDLFSFYREHRIYFSKAVCKQLDGVIKEVAPLTSAAFLRLYAGTGPPKYSDEARERWPEIRQQFADSIEGVIETVEREFRKILGVDKVDEHAKKPTETEPDSPDR